MQDWNVVITVQDGTYTLVRQALSRFGTVYKTDYYNVLLMQVPDIQGFIRSLADHLESHPGLRSALARVMPVTVRFTFQAVEGFEEGCRRAIVPWLGELGGRRFHVRMHRRGFKGRLSSQEQEQQLDHYILMNTSSEAQTQIDFEDPDYILAVETLGQQAGLSLWSRTDRQRYPLLKLD
ncbi:uncharacterized protein FOKN1_2416 [Thiohalobacter thiocyanaticus]|uniref:Uncharacterized protein n=1 Tax=Thiohalobacter thiocyanaticus TaxID=585455 RepID=A0A1Z4VT18_9GAMM|nr:THUMP domain-containing protein [Thiohalobacter thiocyanaticus]BAZ94790.1 uncharacterized protein FOKN1_2416 [Thiohalobacter thiocyanaticus]